MTSTANNFKERLSGKEPTNIDAKSYIASQKHPGFKEGAAMLDKWAIAMTGNARRVKSEEDGTLAYLMMKSESWDNYNYNMFESSLATCDLNFEVTTDNGSKVSCYDLLKIYEETVNSSFRRSMEK